MGLSSSKVSEKDYLLQDEGAGEQYMYISFMRNRKGNIIAIKLRGVSKGDDDDAYKFRNMDPPYDVYGMPIGTWCPVDGHTINEINQTAKADQNLL